MKYGLLCIAIGMHLSVFAQLHEVTDFGDNPGNLGMFTYIPKAVADSSDVPLVIVLHGCTQNAATIAEESGWNTLADRFGFAVLYPEQRRANNISKCFNWFLGQDNRPGKGETQSILNMTVKMHDLVDYDISRVYVFGVSAGAAMAVTMAACYPDNFAGICALAGTPYGVAGNALEGIGAMLSMPDRSPAEWAAKIKDMHDTDRNLPRLIIGHGTMDKVVPIESSYELIDQWCGVYGADPKPKYAREQYDSVPNMFVSMFMAEDVQIVTLFEMEGIGHELPVNPGDGVGQGGKEGRFTTNKGFWFPLLVAEHWGLNK